MRTIRGTAATASSQFLAAQKKTQRLSALGSLKKSLAACGEKAKKRKLEVDPIAAECCREQGLPTHRDTSDSLYLLKNL